VSVSFRGWRRKARRNAQTNDPAKGRAMSTRAYPRRLAVTRAKTLG
jgi:hypothetical protein